MRVRPRAVVGIGLAVVALAAAVFAFRSRERDTRYLTALADRGDVVDVVGATGTLQAVTTVQVGSQVSGTIQSLYADFNSVVKKGQVVARLDPSLFEARLSQSRANLLAAKANLERGRSTVEDMRQKYARARALAEQQLLPASDLETAKASYDGALAQVKADEAAVSQAEAGLNQARVDLAHTVIAAPIDGVVINRSVDVGQTVAASFQAPVLFAIANDLAHMQVNASIDEADIGRVREAQEVSFRVDAYPDQTFSGRVAQIRLQPTTVQNVVTYNTIIAVENPELKLKPGMTATVSLIVRKSENALRVPAAALRFRPEGFQQQRGPGGPPGASGAGGASGGGAPGAGGPRTGAPAAGGEAQGSGERRRQGGERRDGTGRPPQTGADAASGGRGPGGGAAGGRRSLLFLLNDKGTPEPIRVVVGISDGQFVEIKEGLEEGARVVTSVDGGGARPGAPRPGASPSSNPFSPQFQQRRR